MFEAVLVANRGEIAVRVLRTLRRLGVRAITVYGPGDADARHVREADVAVAVPGYLDGDAVVAAALRSGARAIHPGYGFLSENAAFAAAVERAGLVFVGPPAGVIELMGDKIRAKETVAAFGVPVVPGGGAAGMSDGELVDIAREIGFPVLIKPSAGGGGKGMRLVHDGALLADEIAAARRQAKGAFGDDTLLIERWIDRPRHIEIQVLADTHGTVVHLGERECSLQRRHQKIIEEAPSALLDADTRAEMGAAAVRAARACGYVSAGTIEFIVPADDPGSFYFMEMNTRLQVEHPVTELVTRVDLVESQLRIAAGAAIGKSDVSMHGHAVEARIYAEDPDRGFLPTGGRVLTVCEPDLEGVRVDSGLREGGEVGSSYDPMLAKVIAYGEDRATAITRLRAALAQTRVLGVTTNLGFLYRLLGDPAVLAGDLDTGLVEARTDDLTGHPAPPEVAVAAALAARAERNTGTGWVDPFSAQTGWRVGGPAWDTHVLRIGPGEPIEVRVRGGEVSVDGGPPVPASVQVVPGGLAVAHDGLTKRFDYVAETSGVRWLAYGPDTWRVSEVETVRAEAAGGASAGGALTSPMPGTVTVVKAAVGDRVTRGQTVVVVEAMKMEHALTAPFDGVVTEIGAPAGASVAMDQTLAVVTPQEPSAADGNDSVDGSVAAAPGGPAGGSSDAALGGSLDLEAKAR
ncbi:acetyl/propionyl/methylcrotonyl-CoA carboxylase subunit alpha [Embleya sp. NPDC008237]|uniref:acetyl/propionyl/methylcrotonyl-CoA carboxylase subunit alpha n=1 Tax=Embleya sp. NPDC008237 TaxID=3363978 RepID=UPI0036ECC0A2